MRPLPLDRRGDQRGGGSELPGHEPQRPPLVDDDIDVFDESDVLWAIATRMQADRDLVVIAGSLGAIAPATQRRKAGRVTATAWPWATPQKSVSGVETAWHTLGRLLL